ncbi:uncharacterized protein N7503_009149 [Penicillium pulvis]|uniref:uncharacterized protein n=1 Tax=Penicillium pulvis TaxID=1562058 RepID=UPI0025493322|nr:uncharacterized protein N7503_009149 [Penicillium pulvis]KAJ5793171.1 hypothetical protein N7503_009149 [Penicillium pulvis]
MEEAISQTNNVWTDKYFAISMGSIIILFGFAHWGTVAFRKYGPKEPGKLLGDTIRAYRSVRRVLDTVILGKSLDKWLLYLTYWAIDLILVLTRLDLTDLGEVAKRMGWISVANFVLLVFLALRNTPLAPLSGQSYEKLRPLHRVAGYTCIVSSIVHGILYLKEGAETGYLMLMRGREDLAGALAGLSMVIIGLSTISWFARRYYEAFYIIHVVLFMVIVILVGMHRPDLATSTLAIIIFIACMWLSDRFLRALKLSWNFCGNNATLVPMQDGAVRVKLQRGLNCSPGSHAFLWMPSIRLLETHPFTMVSTNPVEFLIRRYDGYTHDLYKLAHERPGCVVRCSVDGGYGQVPDFMDFDKIILVAGGSGATFTFAIAINLIRQCAAANVTKSIDFIWTVKYTSSLKWFQDELRELQDNHFVNLFIHVSQDDTADDSSSGETTPVGSDIEKGRNKTTQSSEYMSCIRRGRPNIADLVASGVSRCPPHYQVGVGACGPMKILEGTRKATSQRAFDHGPSITLHTEEFEW